MILFTIIIVEVDGRTMTGTTHIMDSATITTHGILHGTIISTLGITHMGMVTDIPLTITEMEVTPLQRLLIMGLETEHLRTHLAQ